MTINNDQQFEKALGGIRRIELDPTKKGIIFSKLLRYTEAHPAPEAAGFFASLFLRVKSIFVSSK